MNERENGCHIAMLENKLADAYGCCKLDLLGSLRQQILDFCYKHEHRPRYEGIVCFSTNVCCDLLRVLKEQQLNPADFAIATFDDSPWLEFLTVPLTIAYQPATEISITAVKLLIEKISQHKQAAAHSRPTEIGKEINLPVEIVHQEVWNWDRAGTN